MLKVSRFNNFYCVIFSIIVICIANFWLFALCCFLQINRFYIWFNFFTGHCSDILDTPLAFSVRDIESETHWRYHFFIFDILVGFWLWSLFEAWMAVAQLTAPRFCCNFGDTFSHLTPSCLRKRKNDKIHWKNRIKSSFRRRHNMLYLGIWLSYMIW